MICRDPILKNLYVLLANALHQAWYRRKRTMKKRRPFRSKIGRRLRSYAKRKNPETYDGMWRGKSIHNRVRNQTSAGAVGRNVYRHCHEDAVRREEAVISLLSDLCRQIDVRISRVGQMPTKPEQELYDRALQRVARPATCLTGLSEERRQKISDSLRRAWASGLFEKRRPRHPRRRSKWLIRARHLSALKGWETRRLRGISQKTLPEPKSPSM